ncbi:hypothetical protein RF11_07230 [Thelohanellus kitauei]|uniref:Uncharacterized protein n=1 Tax=Thelohanellus kitauei TaxID=669202 RepID=A0A0C2MTZ9_THEKT|nr:hypothetical protein RF11_07230 [Thelohanellus kitauei]
MASIVSIDNNNTYFMGGSLDEGEDNSVYETKPIAELADLPTVEIIVFIQLCYENVLINIKFDGTFDRNIQNSATRPTDVESDSQPIRNDRMDITSETSDEPPHREHIPTATTSTGLSALEKLALVFISSFICITEDS